MVRVASRTITKLRSRGSSGVRAVDLLPEHLENARFRCDGPGWGAR